MQLITHSLFVTFLVFSAMGNLQENRRESLEYYQKLVAEFLLNTSTWQHPSDFRAYFEEDGTESTLWGNFDFIIVGAGSSGSVLSNRLTESGRFKVLLLEAGGAENDLTDIPIFAGDLMRSNFNWGYRTVPQTTACLGMNEQRCNFPRGKAIGGSSVINFMFYSRGNKDDFDKWAASGNPGWDYKNVLPYFMKSEGSKLLTEDHEFHGHEGPLNVEHVRYNTSLTNLFLKANEEMRRKIVDYNGEVQIGASHLQSTTINGRRCSGAKAFIKKITNRSNLQVLDQSLVLKILIKNRKAYGVEFTRNGKRYQATASKEVILSAGAINSPHLLMISGIGPEEHLREVGVPLVKNLPVGETLQDHQIYFGLQFATNITPEQVNMTELLSNYLDGYGPLTAAAYATALGFINNRAKSKINPNIEYIFLGAPSEDIYHFTTNSLEVTQETWSAIYKPAAGKFCLFIVPELLHPKSKGTLRLKSNNPFDFPLIDLNMLSDSQNIDIEDMLNAIKDVFEMSKINAFQIIGSKYLSDPLPACVHLEHLSDDYWRCAIRQLTTTLYHPVATCKMGPPDDNTAVVNDRLQVHGIDSLRVIDASVIPFSMASHTNAVCYMLAEKGADVIREEYKDI